MSDRADTVRKITLETAMLNVCPIRIDFDGVYYRDLSAAKTPSFLQTWITNRYYRSEAGFVFLIARMNVSFGSSNCCRMSEPDNFVC